MELETKSVPVANLLSRKRIGQNFFWKSAAEGSRVLQALYFVLLARRLGVAELGHFSVGFSSAMLLAAAGDFGLNTLLTRQVAVDRSAGSTVFLQTAYIKFLFFSALFISALFWPDLNIKKNEILLFLGIAASRNLIDQLSYLCLAYEKLLIEAKIKFTVGFFSLILAAIFLHIKSTVISAGVALLGAQLIALLVGSIIIAQQFQSFPNISQWPKFGWPFPDRRELIAMTLITLALAGFSRIDIACLRFLGQSASDIGHYFAAERIIAILCLLPGFLAVASLPVFSSPENPQIDATIKRLRLELLLAGTLTGLLLNLLGHPLVKILYGHEFTVGTFLPLSLLGIALPFMFINHFSLIALIAKQQSNLAARAAFSGFILNLLLDLYLIPKFGILGAAAAAIGGQAIVSILTQAYLTSPKTRSK